MAFIQCSFARCKIFKLTQALAKGNGHLDKENQRRRYLDYNDFFSEFPDLQLPQKHISTSINFLKCNQNVAKVLSFFRRPNWNKQVYLDTFSSDSWINLPTYKKRTHSLSDCKGCWVDYPVIHLSFPFKSSTPNPLQKLQNVTEECMRATSATCVPVSGKVSVELGSEIYKNINSVFSEVTGKEFGEVLTQVKEANVTKKPTKIERQKELTSIRNQVKNSITSAYHHVDIDRPLKNRESLRQYEKCIRNEAFQIPLKPSKPKNHSPSQVDIDLNVIITELDALPDGNKVNWEALGRKCGIRHGNAGQVLKEKLRSHGYNVKRLQNCVQRHYKSICRRRVKRRLLGGKVTMPTHLPAKKVRGEIRKKVDSGDYDIGIPCCTKSTNRLKLMQDGNIVSIETEVQGRKIRLHTIRQKMLDEEDQLGIRRPPVNGSSDRFLKIWHDHSCIENHGYLLVCVSRVYDDSYYLTSVELKEQFGVEIDVVSIVQQPFVYILGKCSSSTMDQLSYVPTRLEDMLEVNIPLISKDGTTVNDVIRFHHGDNPSLQFECGVSQGGEFCCVGCPVSDKNLSNFVNCARQSVRTLENIQSIATGGRYGRLPGVITLTRNMKKKQLLNELGDRGLDPAGTAVELLRRLKDTRQGVEYVPVLLLNSPTAKLTSYNLGDLEIIQVEALHACKGHISNLLDELRSKSYGTLATVMDAFCKGTFQDRELLRARDYREALAILPTYLRNESVDVSVIKLFDSLLEMTQMMYLSPSQRNTSVILRYYNQSFIHFMLLKEVIGQPKSLTLRKLYGLYCHGLVIHAPLLYRIVSPVLLNAEAQEAVFNAAKDISKRTSNHHADNIVPNLLLRLQVEKQNKSASARDIIDTPMSLSSGSVICREWIVKFPSTVQAHCERIADYLEEGQGIWWDKTDQGDIVFCDASLSTHNQQPTLRHFSCTNMAKEQSRVKESWNRIVDCHIELPLDKVRIYSDSGSLAEIRVLNQLTPLSDETEDDDEHVPVPVLTNGEQDDLSDEKVDEDGENGITVLPSSSNSVDVDDGSFQATGGVLTDLTNLQSQSEFIYSNLPSEVEVQPSTSESTSLVTKTARILNFVLGSDKDVQAIDTYRQKLNSSCDRHLINFYKDKLQELDYCIRPKVVGAFEKISNQVKTDSSLNEAMLKTLNRKKKACMALLDSWGWYYSC